MWVAVHYVLAGCGDLGVGSGRLLALTPYSLAIIPPGIGHAIQWGYVTNETGIEGQGEPNVLLCEFVASPVDEQAFTLACGRIHAGYMGGEGLLDHLQEAIVLGFSEAPWMHHIFEALNEEYRRTGIACRSHFSRAFHERYGCSPMEFRRQRQ